MNFRITLVVLTFLLTSCEIFRTPAKTKPPARTASGGGSKAYHPMTKKAEYNPKAVRYGNQTVSDLINTARSYGGHQLPHGRLVPA